VDIAVEMFFYLSFSIRFSLGKDYVLSAWLGLLFDLCFV